MKKSSEPIERCNGYAGISCVDGNCPVANGDTEITCNNCWLYKGCDDCAFDGTRDCVKCNDADGFIAPDLDPELPFT